MSVELIDFLFKVGIFLWIASMVCSACIFVMHIFVPKRLLQTFFKEPYFSLAEIELFTGFPFGYIRTVMFMRLAGFPKSGKKRGLTEAYKFAPPWFRTASKVILIAFLIFSFPLIGLGLLFFFAL